MKYSKQQVVTEAQYAADLIALVLALFISVANTSVQYTGFSLVEFFLMRFSLLNIGVVFTFMLVWLYIFRSMGLYERRSSRIAGKALRIALACGVGSALIIIGDEINDVAAIDHGFASWFWGSSFALTWAFRLLLQAMFKRLHLGDHNVSHVLVVGTTEQAVEIAKEFREDHLHSFNFLGFISASERGACRVDEQEIVADLIGAQLLLQERVVDELVVALALRDMNTQVEDLMSLAAQLGITVRCPTKILFRGVFGHEAGRLSTEQMRYGSGLQDTYLVMRSGYGFSWQYVLKRLTDYLGAAIALLLLSPVMVAAAIAISTTSRGGVFFVQDRYGYNGRVIHLYKFRTMVSGADALQDKLRAEHNEMDGGAFKMRNDPRITRVGAFLRKTSIDELPQLFNVLLGEMSLVGPRPLPLKDYEHFQQVSHMRRLSVLPGITCTWQIGGRNNLSFEEWMALDMAYIDNWNFLNDIKILLKTIPAVVLGRGAS